MAKPVSAGSTMIPSSGSSIAVRLLGYKANLPPGTWRQGRCRFDSTACSNRDSRISTSKQGNRTGPLRPVPVSHGCSVNPPADSKSPQIPLLKRLNNTAQRTRRSAFLQPALRSSGGSRRPWRLQTHPEPLHEILVACPRNPCPRNPCRALEESAPGHTSLSPPIPADLYRGRGAVRPP